MTAMVCVECDGEGTTVIGRFSEPCESCSGEGCIDVPENILAVFDDPATVWVSRHRPSAQ